MNRILYCKIGWMKNYTGKQNGNPRRGGAYNDESIGHEIYNFKSYSGKYYGFVGQGKKKTIHIEKLGADKNSESVKNILVVFVATADEKGQYIVGWYKDAFVYRDSKTVPEKVLRLREENEFKHYNLYAEEAVLIQENERKSFKIEYNGRSNIYYGTDDLNNRTIKLIQEYEEKILNKKTIENIEKDTQNLTGKEKECLIKARVNQGVFRKNLLNKYSKCCLCDICDEQLLIASHIKPWSECEPGEKLKIDNGLLLCPIHDKLFDLNLISFDTKGNIMISNKIDFKSYKDLAISENMSIKLNEEMDKYMECHRKSFQKKYNK